MTLTEALIIADKQVTAEVKALTPQTALAYKSAQTQRFNAFLQSGLVANLMELPTEQARLCVALEFGMRIQRVLDGPEPQKAERPLIVGVM